MSLSWSYPQKFYAIIYSFFGQIKSLIWHLNAFARGFIHLAFGTFLPSSHAEIAHLDTPTAFPNWACDIFAFLRYTAMRLLILCIHLTSLYAIISILDYLTIEFISCQWFFDRKSIIFLIEKISYNLYRWR